MYYRKVSKEDHRSFRDLVWRLVFAKDIATELEKARCDAIRLYADKLIATLSQSFYAFLLYAALLSVSVSCVIFYFVANKCYCAFKKILEHES